MRFVPSRILLVIFVFANSCLCGIFQAVGQAPQKGNNSSARLASATYPLDGVADSNGNIWIVDRNAPGVWRFSHEKLELVIAGAKKFRQPLNVPRCLAFSPSGDLFVGDTATRDVYKRDSEGQTTPTLSSIVGIPMDLAFGADGTMYIADVERRVVWKKGPSDDKPTVFADVNPRGLFMDSSGSLWVVSQNEQQLLRLDSEGKATVVVGERVFDFPHQVVVDSTGTAWITDGYKKALWQLKPNEKPIVAFSGDPFQNPVGLFLINDKPVIVDPHAQSVFQWDGTKPTLWFKVTQ